MTCNHAALRADRERWARLPFVGHWDFRPDGPLLEMKNCEACKSTLSVEINSRQSAAGEG